MDEQPTQQPDAQSESPIDQGFDAVSPQKSPIRPEHPDPPKPKREHATKPFKPDAPRSTSEQPTLNADDALTPDAPLSPAQKAQIALENLSKKMSQVADEYAAGGINEAQFNAIYKRYSEQRQITERLLNRDPDSQAWQTVIQSGHTSFLRSYYAAKIISYGLYTLKDGTQIILQGRVRLPQSQLLPLVSKIRSVVGQGHTLGSAWRKLKDNNWVFIVPGTMTISVVIFALEPAAVQRKQVEDVHRDFERANQKALQREIYEPSVLVFPHRALLQNLS